MSMKYDPNEVNCYGEPRDELRLWPTYMRGRGWDLSLRPAYDRLDLDDPQAVNHYINRWGVPGNRILAKVQVLAAAQRRRWERDHPGGPPFAGVFLTDEWRDRLLGGQDEAPAYDDGMHGVDDPVPEPLPRGPHQG